MLSDFGDIPIDKYNYGNIDYNYFLYYFGITVLIIGLIALVLSIIAMWKVFNKAGIKGWKSLIPFYNIILLYKISGVSPWLVVLNIIIPLIYYFTIYLEWPLFIYFLCCFAALGINIYASIYLARAFGKEDTFAIGLVLMSFIFWLILAFDSSIKYVGNKKIKVVKK